MTDAQKFGANLQRARQRAGLSQSQLARKVGLTTGYVSHLEGGRYTPSFARIVQLAHTLGISPAELFDGI